MPLRKKATEEQIREVAYHMWREAGEPHGEDQEYWFRAEEALNAPKKRKPAAKKPAAKTAAKTATRTAAKKPAAKAAPKRKTAAKKSAAKKPASDA